MYCWFHVFAQWTDPVVDTLLVDSIFDEMVLRILCTDASTQFNKLSLGRLRVFYTWYTFVIHRSYQVDRGRPFYI